MANLEDKVAIVTGSAQGIGRMIALAMVDSGARMVIVDLHEQSCKPVLDEIQIKSGNAIAVACDVTDENQVAVMVNRVLDQYGKIDILVNNAGWQFVSSLEVSSVEDWEKTMAVNLRGPFLCAREVIPIMRKQVGGVIINITSRAGRVPKAKAAAYGASKFGLNGLTQCLNLEVRDDGIRVLALAPPRTNTPLAREIVRNLHPDVDISSWSDGSDFGKTVAWFASDEASFIDGVIIETGGLRP